MVLIARIGKVSEHGCHVNPRVRSFGKWQRGGWEAGDAQRGDRRRESLCDKLKMTWV